MDISVTHDSLSAKDFNPLPRKEGDKVSFALIRAGFDFNPLPRKEGDFHNVRYVCQACLFQSTPS